MSQKYNPIVSTITGKMTSFVRLSILCVLTLLLFNLFVSTATGSSLLEMMFQSSPYQSPPYQPPPFQSSPFQSSPFQSSPLPGNGLGPVRMVNLKFVANSMVNAPDATGKIRIQRDYKDDHPKHDDFPQSIDYAISKLPCQDFGFGREYPEYNWRENGRWFYAIYLTTGYYGQLRLQSFNPGCPDQAYHSWVVVPYIDEATLFKGDLSFEVYLEMDGSGQRYLVMQGEVAAE